MENSLKNATSDYSTPALHVVRSRAAWSLASLMLLMTLAAIVTAALRAGAIQGDGRNGEAELLTVAGVVGWVIGSIIGVAVGIARHGSIGGAFLGLLAGMGFGTVGALLCALPASMPVLLVGSIILIAGALTMRYFSRARDEES